MTANVSVRDSVTTAAVMDVQDFLGGTEISLEIVFFESKKLQISYSRKNKNGIELVSRKIIVYRKMPSVEGIFNQVTKRFPNFFVVKEGLKIIVDGDPVFTDQIRSLLYFDFTEDRIEQLEDPFSSNALKFSRFLRTKNSDFRMQYMLQDPFTLKINGEEHFLVGANNTLLAPEKWALLTKSEILGHLSNPVLRVSAGIGLSDEVTFLFSQNEASVGLAYLDEVQGEEAIRHYYVLEWDLATNYLKLFDSHFVNLFSNPKLLGLRSIISELHSNGFCEVELESGETKIEINLPAGNVPSVVALTAIEFERWQLNASHVKVHDRDGNLVGFVKPLNSSSIGSRYWGEKWVVRKFNKDGTFFDDVSENAVYGVFQIVSGLNFVIKYRWHTRDSKSLWWASYRVGEDEPEFYARFHYFNRRSHQLSKEMNSE
jgi:hypothetical protein